MGKAQRGGGSGHVMDAQDRAIAGDAGVDEVTEGITLGSGQLRATGGHGEKGLATDPDQERAASPGGDGRQMLQ